jgi:D-proline reductase (dithiol) PrdB
LRNKDLPLASGMLDCAKLFPVDIRKDVFAVCYPAAWLSVDGVDLEGFVMSIDSYRFLDFATRQVMKAWAARQQAGVIPFTRLAKRLSECTVALVSTAAIARNDDRPFDQEGERRNPWWGDPSFRVIPLGTSESDVRLYHLHIDPRFGQADLDVVLPIRRLTELAQEGVVRRPAARHYSVMGYVLEPDVLVGQTAPAIAESMRADGVDAAALVPA